MAKAATQGPLCKTVLPTNSSAKDKDNSAALQARHSLISAAGP